MQATSIIAFVKSTIVCALTLHVALGDRKGAVHRQRSDCQTLEEAQVKMRLAGSVALMFIERALFG